MPSAVYALAVLHGLESTVDGRRSVSTAPWKSSLLVFVEETDVQRGHVSERIGVVAEHAVRLGGRFEREHPAPDGYSRLNQVEADPQFAPTSMMTSTWG